MIALVIIVNGQLSHPDWSAVYGNVCVNIRAENISRLSEQHRECKNPQNTWELRDMEGCYTPCSIAFSHKLMWFGPRKQFLLVY
jgi:hypothetical protein